MKRVVSLQTALLLSNSQGRRCATGGPALPPGYVPVEQRSASDESLRFASPLSADAVAASTKKGSNAVAEAPYNPNAHLVEGYVREDGKILRRRGDGEGAILEFVDALPPTKLGQIKSDILPKDRPAATEKELREIAARVHMARDDITRQLAVKSRDDWIHNVDAAQARPDAVTDEQLPIFDDDGHKTLRRETSRGYRSIDGGKTLIPKDQALGIEANGDRDDDVHSAGSSSTAAGGSSSAAVSTRDDEFDENQAAVLAALRNRRKSRSSKLFDNITTIDEEAEAEKAALAARVLPTPPIGGFQQFVRYEASRAPTSQNGDGSAAPLTQHEMNVKRFDPLQQMMIDRERQVQERKEASRKRSVWADSVTGDSNAADDAARGDVLRDFAEVAAGNSRGQGYTSTMDDHAEFGTSRAAQKARDLNGKPSSSTAQTINTEVNEAGDEKISPKNEKPRTSFDVKQYQKDLEELEYYLGHASYDEKSKVFNAKYNVTLSAEERAKFGPGYTDLQKEAGLEGEPIDLAHASPKLQAAAASNPVLKYHPAIIGSQLGLNMAGFKGYAFPPTLELGKLQTDIAIEAAKQDAAHVKAKQKDLLEKISGFDPVQRKQVKLVLADFDRRDTQTALHVLHTYPFADNLSVMLVCGIFLFLYKLQIYCDADELYQEYLGIDIRTLSGMRKPLYIFIAFWVAATMVHPCNLSAIALTRAYRIFLRRPIGPP